MHAFSPMDPRCRKLVHQLAAVYGLKSGSQGSGKKRFTVVQRTQHTAQPQGEAVLKRLQVRPLAGLTVLLIFAFGSAISTSLYSSSGGNSLGIVCRIEIS